jgi:hypothetical protein
MTPEGRFLAAGGYDATIRLWDLKKGGPPMVLAGHTDKIGALAFSASGSTLASGSDQFDKQLAPPSQVKLWDVTTGKEMMSLHGHGPGVTSVVFGANGRTLISGSRGGGLLIWDLASGRITAMLDGHRLDVMSLALSLDGQTLASAGGGSLWYGTPGELIVWDLATGRQRASLRGHWQPTTSVDFSSDGRFLASGSMDGTVRLWDFSALITKERSAGVEKNISGRISLTGRKRAIRAG